MRVSIICPVYNGESYLNNLHCLLKDQEIEGLEVDINYVLTESKDKSEEILKSNNSKYIKILSNEFSHSKTREIMANKVDGDIIVFISQDVKMKNDKWLKNLVTPIIENKCDASFSRQICENNSIEKYIRENNYPLESRIVSESDIEKFGLMTFFYSDASSAVKANVFKKLKGYDGKKLIINEDMYFAHKLIINGYKIKYCSDSEVYHSHIFTFKQLFNRYFDTGVFFVQNQGLKEYSGNGSGIKMLKYVFNRSVKEGNIKVILNIIPNFAARFLGSQLGKKYKMLSINKRKAFSLDKKYWDEFKEEKK